MPSGVALRPLAERQFRLLWLGRVSSAAGDALVPVALTFGVLSVHRSATALGGVLAAFTLARVAFTLVGGVVADRLPRRAVMLACDGVRAVVEAFTAALLLTHHMTLPLFFVNVAIFGAASAFFGPASDGLIPQTVSSANLQQANALLGISRNGFNIVGPAISGVLVAAVGPGWVFAIDAVSFVASASFLLQLDVAMHERAAKSRFLTEIRTGFREVVSRDWVRAPLLGFAITNFCFAGFLVLGPVVFQDHFGGARNWGIVSTCAAVGALAGSVISARIRPRHPLSAGFGVSILLGTPLAALAGPLPAVAIAAGAAAGSAAIAIANTWWETTLQRRIPQQVFARVRSYDLLVSFVFMPIGMVSFPVLAQRIGLAWTVLGAAAVIGLTNLVVAFTPGVQAIEEPRETPEPGSAPPNQVPIEAA